MSRRCLALLVLAVAPAHAAELRFVRDGKQVKQADVSALMQHCGVTTVELDDPNYGARKRYRACPLKEVLAFGFGEPPKPPGSDVFIRCWDGYDKPTSAERLAEDGAYLAFGDADLSEGTRLRWAPLGPRGIDPGPLYLVWTKRAQRDTSAYPWPYQIAEFEIVPFQSKYPHVIPTGVPRTSPAWQGFEIFRGECIACHAINGEGGDTGPDLNVPRSIVEYRPREQIKAYIRDPSSFRYGKMPAHPDLSEADLDALIAYFAAMKERKHDPGHGR